MSGRSPSSSARRADIRLSTGAPSQSRPRRLAPQAGPTPKPVSSAPLLGVPGARDAFHDYLVKRAQEQGMRDERLRRSDRRSDAEAEARQARHVAAVTTIRRSVPTTHTDEVVGVGAPVVTARRQDDLEHRLQTPSPSRPHAAASATNGGQKEGQETTSSRVSCVAVVVRRVWSRLGLVSAKSEKPLTVALERWMSHRKVQADRVMGGWRATTHDDDVGDEDASTATRCSPCCDGLMGVLRNMCCLMKEGEENGPRQSSDGRGDRMAWCPTTAEQSPTTSSIAKSAATAAALHDNLIASTPQQTTSPRRIFGQHPHLPSPSRRDHKASPSHSLGSDASHSVWVFVLRTLQGVQYPRLRRLLCAPPPHVSDDDVNELLLACLWLTQQCRLATRAIAFELRDEAAFLFAESTVESNVHTGEPVKQADLTRYTPSGDGWRQYTCAHIQAPESSDGPKSVIISDRVDAERMFAMRVRQIDAGCHRIGALLDTRVTLLDTLGSAHSPADYMLCLASNHAAYTKVLSGLEVVSKLPETIIDVKDALQTWMNRLLSFGRVLREGDSLFNQPRKVFEDMSRDDAAVRDDRCGSSVGPTTLRDVIERFRRTDAWETAYRPRRNRRTDPAAQSRAPVTAAMDLRYTFRSAAMTECTMRHSSAATVTLPPTPLGDNATGGVGEDLRRILRLPDALHAVPQNVFVGPPASGRTTSAAVEIARMKQLLEVLLSDPSMVASASPSSSVTGHAEGQQLSAFRTVDADFPPSFRTVRRVSRAKQEVQEGLDAERSCCRIPLIADKALKEVVVSWSQVHSTL